MRISGPSVIEAQISFLEDWHWATNDLFELDWTARRYEADIPILIAPTGPADELETASLLFTHAINAARNRIWIASPYFVPDEAVMQALQLASTRGVDVRILIPDKRDHWGAYLAAFTYQARASGTGVRFFRYTDGFMHQKVVLQDDLISAIGTANFDNRSFRLNFEITSIMANKEIAQQIETMLMDDLENSVEMEPDALASKPFWFRLAANLARLTAPIQ